MLLSCPFVAISLFSFLTTTVLSSNCEVCDLTDELAKVKGELAECQVKLTDKSYLGQVCSRVGSWISSDHPPAHLKSTVKEFLSRFDLLSAPLDPGSKGVERDIMIKLSNKELGELQMFAYNDHGSPGDIQDILLRSLHPRDGWMDQTSEFVSQTIGETSLHFKANYVIIFQVCVLLCCVVLPLLLGSPKLPIILFLCLYAVFTTWVRQYYTAAAKKQATLAKHAKIPNSCLLERQGWLAAAQDLVAGMFNGKEDPCEAYYTAAMVDPAFEVGLIAAVIETFSVCIVLPAETLGLALGSYYTCLLEPLPWVWKVPVLVLATILVLFILLLTCGYEFRIPFLLSIGPGRKRKVSDKNEGRQVEREVGGDRYLAGEQRGQREKPEYGRQLSNTSPFYLDSHPSGESDMTDKGAILPYPLGRNKLDDLVEASQ